MKTTLKGFGFMFSSISKANHSFSFSLYIVKKQNNNYKKSLSIFQHKPEFVFFLGKKSFILNSKKKLNIMVWFGFLGKNSSENFYFFSIKQTPKKIDK